MNIYISNLRSAIGDNELSALFTPFGEVKSAQISMDVFTGQSRGFGYVTMDDEQSALNAIKGLDQTEVMDLVISVKEAEVPKQRMGSYKVGNMVPAARTRTFRK